MHHSRGPGGRGRIRTDVVMAYETIAGTAPVHPATKSARGESNSRLPVLQTGAFPLGYARGTIGVHASACSRPKSGTPTQCRRRDSNSQEPRFELSMSASCITPTWCGWEESNLQQLLSQSSASAICATSADGCRRRDSNSQRLVPKTSASASLGYSGASEPGRTRTCGLFVRSEALWLQLSYGSNQRKRWDSNPRRSGYRYLFSRQAPRPAGPLPLWRRWEESNLHRIFHPAG